jgi:hypothetical protein
MYQILAAAAGTMETNLAPQQKDPNPGHGTASGDSTEPLVIFLHVRQGHPLTSCPSLTHGAWAHASVTSHQRAARQRNRYAGWIRDGTLAHSVMARHIARWLGPFFYFPLQALSSYIVY